MGLLVKINKKGFTLVELMLVVVLLGILASVTLTIINPQRMRERARDSTRITDLNKIRTALELRFADVRSYPSNGVWQTVAAALAGPLASYYNGTLPADPKGYSAAYSCGGDYAYSYRSNGSIYVLVARMESTNIDYAKCNTLSNCATLSCSCATNCFGVQNPY